MGPVPVVGGRLMVDVPKNSVLIYDKATNSVRDLAVQFTDVEKNVSADHPKVKGKTFPLMDKEQQTVTVYSRRQKSLITFKIPAEALDYPPYVWTAGDEMRVAFRNAQKTQSIRIMGCAGDRAEVRACAAREACALWHCRFGVRPRTYKAVRRRVFAPKPLRLL